MISEIRNNQTVQILKFCLNKVIQDIYITGWTEILAEYHYFSTMGWWYYVKFDDFLICLSSDTTKGMLSVDIHQKIKCNFEIEDDDKFTVMRINNINQGHYDGWIITDIELFFGNYYTQEPAAVGFQCRDFSGGFERKTYIFFDAMKLNGIEIGNEKDMELFLQDTRHYFEKLI